MTRKEKICIEIGKILSEFPEVWTPVWTPKDIERYLKNENYQKDRIAVEISGDSRPDKVSGMMTIRIPFKNYNAAKKSWLKMMKEYHKQNK